MNTILLIMCFSMIATAAANSGYNYQQPRPISNQIFRPSAPFSSNPASALAPPPPAQYYQPQFSGPSQAHNLPAAQLVNPPSQYLPPYQQPASVPQYKQQQQRQTILTNTIYIHSAPDETEEYFPNLGAEAEPIRKNYRIVFIKAPSHNLRVNLNKQVQASNEEKTIIYVLSKKPDINNIQSQFVQTEQKTHKPEVYFIKYKTQAEANRAQQEIQAQYDALGGSTNVSDEGFAPVTSVIGSGSLNDPSFSSGSNLVSSSSSNQQFVQSASNNLNFGVASPSLGYLPAKNK